MPFCFYVSHIRVTTTHSRTRGTGETVRVSEARFTNHGHWFLVNFFLCGQEELCVFKRIFVLLREPLLLLSGPLTMLLSDLFCCQVDLCVAKRTYMYICTCDDNITQYVYVAKRSYVCVLVICLQCLVGLNQWMCMHGALIYTSMILCI